MSTNNEKKEIKNLKYGHLSVRKWIIELIDKKKIENFKKIFYSNFHFFFHFVIFLKVFTPEKFSVDFIHHLLELIVCITVKTLNISFLNSNFKLIY